MSSEWIQRLFLHPSRSQRRRYFPVRKNKKPRFRPGLEVLEDRITPTTFNATSAADLQSDFAYANSNPTQQVIINLSSSGSYNLSAIGTQLTDQNTAGIILSGNGAKITAASNNRIFGVDKGDNLTLNNLTLTGGGLTGAPLAAALSPTTAALSLSAPSMSPAMPSTVASMLRAAASMCRQAAV